MQRARGSTVLKWVSRRFLENQSQVRKLPIFPHVVFSSYQTSRLYRTKKCLAEDSPSEVKFTPTVIRKAEAAFSDYLHSTRSLQFAAAESISKNSPRFLSKLLEKIDLNDNVERSVARFLRYHPINEFEPFFESIGLKPSEYAPLLPQDLMFLSDCDWVLTNYLVLCNYGIGTCKIGRIYKNRKEIFEQEHGVLLRNIQAYENLGVSQRLMVKAILCSPCLLIGHTNKTFVEVLERLGVLGFKKGWIEGQLCESGGYRWSQILELLCLFSQMGFTNEQLYGLIKRNPRILFEDSGARTFSLIGFLVKFGSTRNNIQNVFLESPKMNVGKFLSNLKQCFIFLTDIDMEAEEIDRIIRSEAPLLGLATLKKANSMLVNLNVGKKRLCDIIKKNPKEMRNWVLGVKVTPLPGVPDEISMLERRKFLLRLGMVNGSKNVEKMVKSFRGRGQELQERFDCIVKSGLDVKDVREMVRVSPQILNQTKEVIEMKIDFLVHEIKHPILSLKRFPSYLSFKIERIKVRLMMFKWLSDRRVAHPNLALSTIIACSDGAFEKLYVMRHPEGLKVWHNLRNTVITE